MRRNAILKHEGIGTSRGDGDHQPARSAVVAEFTIERLISEHEQDEHLNGIILRRWDAAGNRFRSGRIADAMKANGDALTPAGLVCLAKTAARMGIEQAAESEDCE